jgi:hypothetical protein
MGSHGASMSQLAVMGPPAVTAQQLILVGAQPPGFEFVGQNLGLVILGHPDIVQAPITDEGDDEKKSETTG